MNITDSIEISELFKRLGKIKGGYNYSGAASYQICFPLKDGGELRFMLVDGDASERRGAEIVTEMGLFDIDLYGGELPPGISGPVSVTG